MQTAGKGGVLYGTRAVGIPMRIAQRIHRPAERDLYGPIQHGLHRRIPLLEVRRGLVVLERCLIVVDFIKGKQRGVGLVLDDVKAAAAGLVEDGAGGVGNRGFDKVVDVVLLGFEPNHKNVHSTSLLARLAARPESVTLELVFTCAAVYRVRAMDASATPRQAQGDEEERKEITLGETEIPRVSRCNGFGKAILEA